MTVCGDVVARWKLPCLGNCSEVSKNLVGMPLRLHLIKNFKDFAGLVDDEGLAKDAFKLPSHKYFRSVRLICFCNFEFRI